MAKILIVDDSEITRIQLKNDLAAKGHQVIEGCDGLDGLKVLGENKDVQLIVCDVNMPNMKGLEMCAKVHENPDLNHIPIFMLTTESDEGMKAEGKQVGVKGWMTKPCKGPKLEKFLGAIDKVLERG